MFGKIKKFIIPTIIILLVLILGGSTCYFYDQFTKLKQDPQKIARQETETLIARVSRLIVLPEGEEPTIATVSDPERLKDQPFFAKAKVGDKVLIYTNAKKAILYDPVNNKIVEVAPINIGTSQSTTQSTTQSATP
jgi:hypothetical protein